MSDEQGLREQIKQFDFETRRNKNQIRFDSLSGLSHKDAVMNRCRWMMIKGQDFYTRARHYKSNMCADIYCIPYNCIIEIQDKEKDTSIERKRLFWESNGFNFEVVKIKSNDFEVTQDLK